jgi:hypothetical protein
MTTPVTSDTTDFTWRIEQNENEALTFPVLDANGELFPIDGWAIDAKIKTRPGGATLYTWPSNLAVFDSDNNTLELSIPATVSAAWTFRTGWFRVVITSPDAASYRILSGIFVIDPD